MSLKRVYHLPVSKSDDLIYHHEIDQDKHQNLRESHVRKGSLNDAVLEMPVVKQGKRNSYNSVTFHNENSKIKLIQTKKKVLTQIAQYGYNAYMAEYLIQKQNISLEQDFQNLLEILISKMHEFEEQYKQCPKQSQKKIGFKQIKPISQDEQQNIQLDQFIEENIVEEVGNMCGICMCEYVNKRKPLNCKHEFCQKCIGQYLENKINCAQVLEIECPGQDCESYFNSDIIKEYVDEEYFDKYGKFKETKMLDKDDTVRWCVRPGCDKFVRGNMFSKVVKCECGQMICYDCRREDHTGMTCDQALDKYYEQTMKQLVIQRCPKCKAPIQKKEGCNHMTCFQCRFQFCWICRARYTRMHYDSDNCFGCPDKQFSTDEPARRPLWKKYGGIIFEIFASTLILPLLPFILIYYSVMTPLKLIKLKNRQYYRSMDDGEKLCFLLIGILLFPVFMAIIIFPGTLFLLAYKLRYD